MNWVRVYEYMGRIRRTEGMEYTMELKVRFNDIQKQNMVTRIQGSLN
jgi:hypothetical protein